MRRKAVGGAEGSWCHSDGNGRKDVGLPDQGDLKFLLGLGKTSSREELHCVPPPVKQSQAREASGTPD